MHQRRQGGGLARAGRSGDQHQAVLQFGELSHHRRQGELFNRRQAVGDDAEHGSNAARLLEQVGAKASHLGQFVDEVQLLIAIEGRALLGRKDFQQKPTRVGLAQGAKVERHQIAVVANQGHHAGVKVQIARLLLNHQT